MSADAIARLRITLADNDAFAPGGIQMLADRADLRALLDEHTEALDALHGAMELYPYINCRCGRGHDRLTEHVRGISTMVLAKAGRR